MDYLKCLKIWYHCILLTIWSQSVHETIQIAVETAEIQQLCQFWPKKAGITQPHIGSAASKLEFVIARHLLVLHGHHNLAQLQILVRMIYKNYQFVERQHKSPKMQIKLVQPQFCIGSAPQFAKSYARRVRFCKLWRGPYSCAGKSIYFRIGFTNFIVAHSIPVRFV